METQGSISSAEASAALASVERSRARVAWSGYPRWYWFGTATGLAALPLAVLLPVWLGLVLVGAVGVVLFRLAIAGGRARGVCEGWTRTAVRAREVALLYGPAVAVSVAGSMVAAIAWWSVIPAAVLVFALFAGTGLTLSARAERR